MAAGRAIRDLQKVAVEKHNAAVMYDKATMQVMEVLGMELTRFQGRCLPDKSIDSSFKEYMNLFKEFAQKGVLGFKSPPCREDMDLACTTLLYQQTAAAIAMAVVACTTAPPSSAPIIHAEVGLNGYNFIAIKYKTEVTEAERHCNIITSVGTSLVTALTIPLLSKLESLFYDALRICTLKDRAVDALATHRLPEKFDVLLLKQTNAVRAACLEDV